MPRPTERYKEKYAKILQPSQNFSVMISEGPFRKDKEVFV